MDIIKLILSNTVFMTVVYSLISIWLIVILREITHYLFAKTYGFEVTDVFIGFSPTNKFKSVGIFHFGYIPIFSSTAIYPTKKLFQENKVDLGIALFNLSALLTQLLLFILLLKSNILCLKTFRTINLFILLTNVLPLFKQNRNTDFIVGFKSLMSHFRKKSAFTIGQLLYVLKSEGRDELWETLGFTTDDYESAIEDCKNIESKIEFIKANPPLKLTRKEKKELKKKGRDVETALPKSIKKIFDNLELPYPDEHTDN